MASQQTDAEAEDREHHDRQDAAHSIRRQFGDRLDVRPVQVGQHEAGAQYQRGGKRAKQEAANPATVSSFDQKTWPPPRNERQPVGDRAGAVLGADEAGGDREGHERDEQGR